ncbi:hypothetical protein M514_01104, partial [Trichuris suis]
MGNCLKGNENDESSLIHVDSGPNSFDSQTSSSQEIVSPSIMETGRGGPMPQCSSGTQRKEEEIKAARCLGILQHLPVEEYIKENNNAKESSSDKDSRTETQIALDMKGEAIAPIPLIDLKTRFQFLREQRQLACAAPPAPTPVPQGLRRFYWKIQILTYSVNNSVKPSADFYPTIFYPVDTNRINFDMVAVGLQDVYYEPIHMITNLIYERTDPWAEMFKTFYASRGFARLTFNKSAVPRMMGTVLMVFVKRELLQYVRSAELKYVSTALNGLSGRKGAICVRLTIGDGVHVTLINSHLTPEEEAMNYRVWEFKRITEMCDFSQPYALTKDDYVFWFGNMNWSMLNIDKNQLLELIQFRAFSRLMDFDELTTLRNAGAVFAEYEEAQISFLPTYRYVVGTPRLDVSYLPAYCDRILFRSSPGAAAFPTFELEVFNMKYETFMTVGCSNHKPLLGSYACTYYLEDNQKPPIVFLSPSRNKGVCWISERSNICTYSQEMTYKCGMFDWIGVFHLKFADDWDVLAFSYMIAAFEKSRTATTYVQNILFPSCCIPTPGTYLFGCFSQRSGCLIALSEPFEVVDRELGMDSSVTFGTDYTAEHELIFHPPQERHLRAEDPRIKEEREAAILGPTISSRESKFKPHFAVAKPMPPLHRMCTRKDL